MFENFVFNVLYYIIWIIEIVGICIITFGTFYALIKLFVNKYRSIKNKTENSSSAKLVLANYLALSLEFLLAAEILRTVTISRELSEILILGAIIILRAAMSLLISWELSYEEKKENLIEKKRNKNNVRPL